MVNFENGTLVKGAYVEINGVQHPVHMPEYSGNTPITAENLNKMQNELIGSMICAYSDSGMTLNVEAGTQVYANLNLNQVLLQRGSDLIVENGGIKCMKAGLVFVKGSIRFYGGTTRNGARISCVLSNETTNENSWGYYEENNAYDVEYQTISCAGYMKVNTDDKILLKTIVSGTSIKIQEWNAVTNLSVKYV